jgi:hypothetical protein
MVSRRRKTKCAYSTGANVQYTSEPLDVVAEVKSQKVRGRERDRFPSQSSAIQMHMREFCIATQSYISTKFVYGQLKSVFLQKSCFCKKPLLDNMCTVTRRRGNTKGKRRLLMFFLPVVIFSV